MNLNIVRSYRNLSVTLSHGFHPVDENGSIFVQSVSLCDRFSSFGWNSMISKLLLKSTVGGSHMSDFNRWNLFRPINHSVVTYRLLKCQYFFFGSSHSTVRLIWNELSGGSIVQLFSDEKCIPALFFILIVLPLQRALVVGYSFGVGAFRCLWC